MKFATRTIHTGNEPNLDTGGSGDVVTPIHLSTTFARRKVNRPTGGYEYSRSGNPTRFALEKNLAALENGKYAYAFSSGLAAVTNVLLLHEFRIIHYLTHLPGVPALPASLPAGMAGRPGEVLWIIKLLIS